MNKMNNVKFVMVDNNDEDNQQVGVGRLIGYFGILAIICIISFLIAKYILRKNIDWEETPIDTSERL